MQIIRTITWVIVALALLIFSINNWNSVEIKIWEDLVLETKIPALVIVSFLIGLLPVWLLHRGTRWQMRRRIKSLETAVRTTVAGSAAASSADQRADSPSPDQAPDQEA